jgi:hypothetical protein
MRVLGGFGMGSMGRSTRFEREGGEMEVGMGILLLCGALVWGRIFGMRRFGGRKWCGRVYDGHGQTAKRINCHL